MEHWISRQLPPFFFFKHTIVPILPTHVHSSSSPGDILCLSLWVLKFGKDYITLLFALSLSLSQTDSPAAGRQDREEGVHHGHFTWHQSADSHFLTQQQPQRCFQVLPQSVYNQGMTVKSSPCQKASATKNCKSTRSFCYTPTCHLSAFFILAMLYLDFFFHNTQESWYIDICCIYNNTVFLYLTK